MRPMRPLRPGLPPCGSRKNGKLPMKQKFYDIQGLVEASYKQGFSDGYDAALLALEAILKGIGHDDDDSLLQGMRNTKRGAYEYMGCPPTAEKVFTQQSTGTIQ